MSDGDTGRDVPGHDGESLTGERVGSDDEPRYGERAAARPAPQYGEYAPPGWVSPVPPVVEKAPENDSRQASGSGSPSPLFPPQQRRYDAPPPSGSPVPGAPPAPTGRASANRLATLLLLAFGLFNVLSSALTASSFGTTLMNQMKDFGYPTERFESAHALAVIGSIAGIGSVVVFVLVAAATLRRLRAGKISWWLPLVAGIVVNLAVGVSTVAVLVHDPSFAAYMQAGR